MNRPTSPPTSPVQMVEIPTITAQRERDAWSETIAEPAASNLEKGVRVSEGGEGKT